MKDFKELIKIADVYGTETKGLAEQREAEIQKNLDEGMWDDLVGGISSLAKKLGIDPATADKVANTISTQPDAKAEVEKAEIQDPTGNGGGADAAAKAAADAKVAQDPTGGVGGADAAAKAAADARIAQDPTGGVGGADAAAKAASDAKVAQDPTGGVGGADAAAKAAAVSANLMKDYNAGGKKPMPAIKDLQTKLAAAGHDPNGIDGKYGPGTFKAVKEFQVARGLKADGQAGPETIKALSSPAPAAAAAPVAPAPVAAATTGPDGNPTSVPAAPPTPAAPKTIATEASMNISMNGTDAGEVADLVDILKNAGVDAPEELAMRNMPTMSLSGPGSPLNKGPIGLGAFDGGPMDDKPRSMMDKPSSGPFDGGPMDDKPGSASGGKSCDVCGGMHEEYDAIVAEWDNSPDPEYKDSDYMINDLAGGINRPKKSFAPVNGGDNPMKLSVKETLQKALNETKKSKKWK
jgi:hypothetical protein